jgi:hypothetical protein
MSFLLGKLNESYDASPISTAVAITGTSSALYGVFGARKLNQGDLATLNGAILLTGVPVSIYLGNQIINENIKRNKQPFAQFYWMAAPAAIAVTLGLVGMFVPAKKQDNKLCYDTESDSDDEDEDDDEDGESCGDEEEDHEGENDEVEEEHDDEDLKTDCKKLVDILKLVFELYELEGDDLSEIKKVLRKLAKIDGCESIKTKIDDLKKAEKGLELGKQAAIDAATAAAKSAAAEIADDAGDDAVDAADEAVDESEGSDKKNKRKIKGFLKKADDFINEEDFEFALAEAEKALKLC